ncbi:7603_t:CDS:2 [Paraglomus occultum]|uniref:7603_t:CDS:1 n=1 Tax=Paraglomus occultum TaxID=144539 RepID=A0A9N8W8F8_9GLOM|nr:7603_t:CDS:2 [Paraglomus occultum]
MAESLNDFIAGYVSGVAGLLVGSPLDILKVRLQTYSPGLSKPSLSEMIKTEGVGVASPIVGLAFLNSILFASYGGILRLFSTSVSNDQPTLTEVYVSGFGAGVACFLASTPTELVKCKTQVLRERKPKDGVRDQTTSWSVFKTVLRQEGIRGLFQGGWITIIRDAPGYAVYFWTYEGLKRTLGVSQSSGLDDINNVSRLLFAGGMAGLLSWASVYPLDTIKSRIQTQNRLSSVNREQEPIIRHSSQSPILKQPVSEPYKGVTDCIVRSYRAEGIRVFFRGITPTLLRAWPVNAVFTILLRIYGL